MGRTETGEERDHLEPGRKFKDFAFYAKGDEEPLESLNDVM